MSLDTCKTLITGKHMVIRDDATCYITLYRKTKSGWKEVWAGNRGELAVLAHFAVTGIDDNSPLGLIAHLSSFKKDLK